MSGLSRFRPGARWTDADFDRECRATIARLSGVIPVDVTIPPEILLDDAAINAALADRDMVALRRELAGYAAAVWRWFQATHPERAGAVAKALQSPSPAHNGT